MVFNLWMRVLVRLNWDRFRNVIWSEKWMLVHLSDCHSLFWVKNENFSDEIFPVFWNVNALDRSMYYWKGIVTVFNFLIGHFYLIRLEGRSSKHQGVANNSSWPDINFIGVSNSSLNNLRCYVVGCSTHCSFFLIKKL